MIFQVYKKRLLVGSFSVIAGMAILIGYVQSAPTALSYAEAESIFEKWQASPSDEKLYAGMKEALRHVPELKKRYEPLIAQKLLIANKIDDALVLANKSLGRIKEEVPYHANFAEASLLIEQGGFQKAFEWAVALKEKMEREFSEKEKENSFLYLHNLLRIACLQKELGNRPGELAAWEELEHFMKNYAKISREFIHAFSAEKVDLTQYIQERKNLLY